MARDMLLFCDSMSGVVLFFSFLKKVELDAEAGLGMGGWIYGERIEGERCEDCDEKRCVATSERERVSEGDVSYHQL